MTRRIRNMLIFGGVVLAEALYQQASEPKILHRVLDGAHGNPYTIDPDEYR